MASGASQCATRRRASQRLGAARNAGAVLRRAARQRRARRARQAQTRSSSSSARSSARGTFSSTTSPAPPRPCSRGRSPARVDGATTARIQCTPDLQPTDVDGPLGLRPARACLLVPARARLHEHPARRRDQPGDAANAERAPRGDGRAADHGRRPAALAAEPVPHPRDREPARPRGRLPAPRGPARPLLPQGGARLPAAGRGARDRPGATARAPARPARARDRDRRPAVAAACRRGRVHRPAAAAAG